MKDSNLTFAEYVKAATNELERIYGITRSDAGIALEEIITAQETWPDPSDWVKWFALKYDLTRKEEVWIT